MSDQKDEAIRHPRVGDVWLDTGIVQRLTITHADTRRIEGAIFQSYRLRWTRREFKRFREWASACELVERGKEADNGKRD